MRRTFDAGRAVVPEGGIDRGLWFVSSGALTATVTRASGDRAIVEFLGPGDAFGEGWMEEGSELLLQPEIRTLTRSALLRWPGWTIAESVARDERFRQWVVARMAARLHRSRAAMVRTLGLGAAERIERLLLDLAEVHGSHLPDGVRVDVPLSQDVLAAAVGASRETVNRAVRSLEAGGRLRRRGQVYSVVTRA